MYSISTYAIDIDSSTFKDSSIAIRQKNENTGRFTPSKDIHKNI
jgi:hypothetical protein